MQTCSNDSRIHFALQECCRANLDVICLQEVRLLNSGSVSHLNYDFYWCGMKRFKRNGVGIAIKKSLDIVIKGIIYISDRLMAADITVKGCKIRIISCYAPTLNSTMTSKQKFYQESTTLTRVEKPTKVMIQGDFNCEPQFCRSHSCYDGSVSQLDDNSSFSNENVMMFLRLCQKNKLSILNTWFDHPIHHRETWHHPNMNLNIRKVYDYSVSESWLRQFVTDVRVRNSYFYSDHRLVVTKMRTPANKAARQFVRRPRLAKPNIQMLQDVKIKENVTKSIQQHLEHTTAPSSLNATHDYIIEALSKGKEKVPPIPKHSYQTVPAESDPELCQLNVIRTDLRKRQTNSNVIGNLKEINKRIKQRVKYLQNKLLGNKAKEINEAKQHRNIVKMWRNAKAHGASMFAKSSALTCPGLKSYFSNHFNPDQSMLITPPEVVTTPEYIKVLQNSNLQIIEDCPSGDEIRKGVEQLNNRKSSLDVEAEFFKVAIDIPSFLDNLKNYFSLIWTTKQIPDKWSISRITPIWKREGNAMDPSKYRGISIGSSLCKVAMNIILNRLTSFYNSQLLRTQFGFRSGLGCNDGIYAMKQLQDIACLSQRKLYCCFIDLTAAFDHVNRDLLFKTIRCRLPPNTLSNNISIIENLYRSTKSYMQNDNPDSDSFDTTAGVRQGGKEGPPVFNLYNDFCLRVVIDRKHAAGVTGLGISYHIPDEATDRSQKSRAPASGEFNDDECGYADDLAAMCWSLEELQICMDLISQVFSEFGLTISLDKTKTLIFNWNSALDGEYPESIATINNQEIENLTSFKYLGVWFTGDCLSIGNDEIDHRVSSAHNAFAEHRSLLTNMKINLNTRMMFLQSLVRSRLTYGCHCWRPSLQELNKIESTYRFFLRCMVWNGHTRVNPPARDPSETETEEDIDWRFVITNDRLYELTNSTTIQEFYQQQQIRWISHVIRRENDNVSKILTFHCTKRTKIGRKSLSILERAVANSQVSYSQFLKDSFKKNNH